MSSSSKKIKEFKDACYEAYRLEWMISHGYGLGDLLDSLGNLENGFNGSLWVCKDEFLTHEFLDPEYMGFLLGIMPNKEGARRLYEEATGNVLEDEHLEVCTSAGVLKAYRCVDPDQPGISVVLNPSGFEDIIDVSYVSVYENPEYASDNERPVDVAVMTYADPYTEDYTAKDVLRREDVMGALQDVSSDVSCAEEREATAKKAILKFYEGLTALPKPETQHIGGTFYGSTELISTVGNSLKIITGGYTSYDYGINTHYYDVYACQVGGAYGYRAEEKELREKLAALVTDTDLSVIYDIGTNFSVIGIGLRHPREKAS